MRLPAPALACGCAACKARLQTDFAQLVRHSYGMDEIHNLILLDIRLSKEPPVSPTITERIAPYTRRLGMEY